MKELVVISGKGGTGKTSLVACFAALAGNKIIVDCDVDASNLHLVLNPDIKEKHDFYAGKIATIIKNKCNHCGKCLYLCRFNAINVDFTVNEINCEGCGVCSNFCPSLAIEMKDCLSGEWFISETRFGKFVHARLGIAKENSGKLVTTIKNQARLLAKSYGKDLILIDGSPGTGCPVIASISGASLILIVTEPTPSGLHDAKRVFELAGHFNIKTSLCINKSDLNPDLTSDIKSFCKKNNIIFVGEIPYTQEFTQAQIKGLTVIEYSETPVKTQIQEIWIKLKESLEGV